ncbi:MAG: glycosyltransferase family 4 protein [Chloroflexaceae bacterium]|nr:glycosyltransferase family 4 protein [Chloroflexaceae bacterium]
MTRDVFAPRADVLLTVSGTIASASATAAGPRFDYEELSRVLPADLIDFASARRLNGRFGRLLEQVGGPALNLAWAVNRLARRYRVVLTDGEQVGLPLATFFLHGGQRPRHLMIAHVISRSKKALLIDVLRLHRAIDCFLVYATFQQRYLQARWRLSSDQVVLTPFMVDSEFFHPDRVPPAPTDRPMVFAVGREARDYPTLLRAFAGLDADLIIAPESRWSRRSDSSASLPLPPNVRRDPFLDFEQLRLRYAASRFVVIPLYPVDFQAGVTSILEAMAMGKAVICTRTNGQSDVVVDGQTGLYVPPGDPLALRAAVQHLLTHPEEAERMGRAGRRRVERHLTIERYVARIASLVSDLRQAEPVTV